MARDKKVLEIAFPSKGEDLGMFILEDNPTMRSLGRKLSEQARPGALIFVTDEEFRAMQDPEQFQVFPPPKAIVTLVEALTYLYAHEINCEVKSIWDGGFIISVGNPERLRTNTQVEARDLDKAGGWLLAEARKLYPEKKWNAYING